MWKFTAEPSHRQELWTIVTERVKLLISAQQWESRHGGFAAAKVCLLDPYKRLSIMSAYACKCWIRDPGTCCEDLIDPISEALQSRVLISASWTS